MADRLSKESKISAVYSSDLKRAFGTAQIIANGCGVIEVCLENHLLALISITLIILKQNVDMKHLSQSFTNMGKG